MPSSSLMRSYGVMRGGSDHEAPMPWPVWWRVGRAEVGELGAHGGVDVARQRARAGRA